MAKENKLTPGSNLMWEGSRMMLPEHVRMLQRHQKELRRREPPVLDEQERERIGRLLAEAAAGRRAVRLKLFDAYEDVWVSGKVRRHDPHGGEIEIERAGGERERVRLDQLVDVDLC
ncbi:MAG TPA: YolD-like family protein [Bacillales bacterium]|nr:YolD-like family protein [Bacillales bacterium]